MNAQVRLKGWSTAGGSTGHVAFIESQNLIADDSVTNACNKSVVTPFNKRVALSDFFM